MKNLNKKQELIHRFGKRWLEIEFPFMYPLAVRSVALLTDSEAMTMKERTETAYLPFNELGYTRQEQTSFWCKLNLCDNRTYEIITFKLARSLNTGKAEREFLDWAESRE